MYTNQILSRDKSTPLPTRLPLSPIKKSAKTALERYCRDHLMRQNIYVDEVWSHAEAKRRVAKMKKSKVSPLISKERQLINTKSFWLFMKTDTQDVGCASVQLHNMSGRNPIHYWTDLYSDCYDAHVQTFQNFKNNHAKFPKDLRGMIAYLGDFFIEKEFRGNKERVILFTHLLFCRAFSNWPNANLLYAFIRNPDVLGGRVSLYGFTEAIPSPLRFKNVEGRSEIEHFVSITARDFNYLRDLYRTNPHKLLEQMA